MFKQKSIYFIGVLLLIIGLFWIHSADIIFHLNPKNEEPEKHPNKPEEIDLKFALLGLIPTLLGIYLIDKHNRSLGRN